MLHRVKGRPRERGRFLATLTMSARSSASMILGRPPAHLGSRQSRPASLKAWITSRTRSGEVWAISAITLTLLPPAEARVMSARRQVMWDLVPAPRRTIRTRRWPSASVGRRTLRPLDVSFVTIATSPPSLGRSSQPQALRTWIWPTPEGPRYMARALARAAVVAPDDSPATGGSAAGGDLNVTQPTAHGATGGVPPGHFEEQHGGAVGSAHGGAVGSASGLLVSTDLAPVESKNPTAGVESPQNPGLIRLGGGPVSMLAKGGCELSM